MYITYGKILPPKKQQNNNNKQTNKKTKQKNTKKYEFLKILKVSEKTIAFRILEFIKLYKQNQEDYITIMIP